jgi:hypothetical protein
MIRATIATCFAIAVVIAAAPAHADAPQAPPTREASDKGFYFEETGGLSLSHGRLGDYVDGVLHIRVGVGWRHGNLAIEPWLAADLDGDRDGSILGVGGKPAAGGADLSSYGADAKYLHRLWRGLEVYGRAGPLYASGTGALATYGGFGFGGGGGIQLTGSVRALGFLFVPLFWSNRGPLVTGGIFIDEGVDWYALHDSTDRMPEISSRVGHLSAGFAIGSSF